MKAVRIMLALTLLIMVVGMVAPTMAQDNGCNPDDVVFSFSSAVSSDSVDDWLSGYTDGNCSEAIKLGALELFDSYQMMNSSGVSETTTTPTVDDNIVQVPITGDTVIRINDVLGQERELAIFQTILDVILQEAKNGYEDLRIGIRTGEGVFAVIPLDNFRTMSVGANGQAIVTLANGISLTGEVQTTVDAGASSGSANLVNTTEVTLVSLSEEPQPFDASTGTWLLEISDSETFVATNPRIIYRYNGTKPNCVGACSTTYTRSTTDFTLEFSGQSAALDIYTPDQIEFHPNSVINLVMPNNATEIPGTWSLGFSKHIAVDLIEEGYTLVIDIESNPVTLIKQE